MATFSLGETGSYRQFEDLSVDSGFVGMENKPFTGKLLKAQKYRHGVKRHGLAGQFMMPQWVVYSRPRILRDLSRRVGGREPTGSDL